MKLDFGKRSVPLVLAILFVSGFALLIPWLGLYLGDWEVLLAARAGQMLSLAPNVGNKIGWMNVFLPLVSFLGASPLLWQILSLIARYLTVLVIWWGLLRLWPGRIKEVTWVTLLFAVYPVFSGQQIALVSSQYWIGYVFFFLSLGAMVQSMRTVRYKWLFYLIALASTFLYPLFLKGFLGFEIIRLFILWFLSLERQTIRKRLSFSFIIWLPFIFIAFMAGFVLLNSTRFSLTGVILERSNPSAISISSIPQTIVRDSIDLILNPWYNIIEPTSIDFADRFWLLTWFIAIPLSVLIGIYMLHLKEKTSERQPIPAGNFTRQAVVLGLACILVCVAPYWIGNTSLGIPFFQSPASILPMFGLSLLVVPSTFYFIELESRKVVVLSILLGLAISFQIRTANDFRWQWVEQARFYWQLYWRAPMIFPDTLITSDSPFFNTNGGDLPISAGINLLYPAQDEPSLSYRFRALNGDKSISGASGSPKSDLPDSGLMLTYEPENGNCLWLLNPGDYERPQVSKALRARLDLINLDQLIIHTPGNWLPPGSIFGKEPEHGWCYFYQKAELARQTGDFPQIVALGNQVFKAGYEPNNVQEWVPFIVGYAHEAHWKKAREITEIVYKSQPVFSDWLCSSWESILIELQPPSDEEKPIDQLLTKLQCKIGQ